MKQYISAQMNVVRLGNDIIATSNPGVDNTTIDPNIQGGQDGSAFGAPSRRNRDSYDF